VADVTTVSLRSQDVQAIVTGLASNPDALSTVALMIRTEQQHSSGINLPPVPLNQGQQSKCCSTPHQRHSPRTVTHSFSPPSVAKGVIHSNPWGFVWPI